MRQVKTTLVLGCLVTLIGCSSYTRPAGTEQVRVTRNPEQTKFCKFLGEITETTKWGLKDTEDRMRAKAAELGGDTLYIGPKSAQFQLSGEAYLCVPK